MTTEKQIEANRKNALKGGVKTDKGKEMIKYNAEKHGIWRSSLNEDELTVYDKMMKRFYSELQPQTQTEEMLIHQITFNQIQLFRCQNEQNKEFELYLNYDPTDWGSSVDYFIFESGSHLYNGKFSILNRYETNLENRIMKALNQLERLRRIREGEFIPPPISIGLNTGE
tara:strand:- start:1 stop:510 length:510 start_codon:yes stop_codon:yes gene_type:complete